MSIRRVVPLLAIALGACTPAADVGGGENKTPAAVAIPAGMRKYLEAKYFQGREGEIDAAVEPILTPKPIVDAISALDWERGQLEKFGEGKRCVAFVKCPDGMHVVHFRGEFGRNDRPLTAARERILRRLYSAGSFAEAEEPALKRIAEPGTALAAACKKAGAGLDEATRARAKKNLELPTTKAAELARALAALADEKDAPELCRAAVWLISRMDGMTFGRFKEDESGRDLEKSINDLASVDARTFYENVFYAVKARREFPWGASLPDHDWLHFVLSPRGTDEPQQRWRRHFYEALAPEFKGLDAAQAIQLAREAAYDFFQYEGNTTWEDFGALTALAVHEGRCEDCTNVENAFLRAVALPGANAFTPYWGHGDGNHAWSWVPGFTAPGSEGGPAVKVYVKAWDGLEDVTDVNTKTATVELAVDAADGEEAELCVWNMDEWRRVAKAPVKAGKAVFEKVGCRDDRALAVRAGSWVRAFVLRSGGAVEFPADAPLATDGPTVEVRMDGTNAAGVALGDYGMYAWTAKGWQCVLRGHVTEEMTSVRVRPGRLYRMQGELIGRRVFEVAEQNGLALIRAR